RRGREAGSTGIQAFRSTIGIICRIHEGALGNRLVGKPLQTLSGVPRVGRREAGRLLIRQVEMRILHSQRLEYTFPEKLVQGHSRNPLYKVSQNIHGKAVLVSLARREQKRQSRKGFDVVGDLAVVLEEAVGDA